MGLFRRRERDATGRPVARDADRAQRRSGKRPDFVRVAVARHQPETELLISLLAAADIPAMAVRTRGFDVPDMLAAGPRDIMVPAHLELDARAVLQPPPDDAADADDDA